MSADNVETFRTKKDAEEYYKRHKYASEPYKDGDGEWCWCVDEYYPDEV